MSPRTNKQFEAIRRESKTKILMAALELFAIDGYHNTSISKVAKQAGVSKGLMYNYFDSKESLLKEVVIMSLADAKEIGDAMIQNLQEATPKDVVRQSLHMFFELLVKSKTMWKLTFSLAMQVSNMPSIKKVIWDMFDDVLQQFEKLLQINGYKNYKIEARLLAAQLDGIAFHYLVFEGAYDLDTVKKTLIKKYCS